LTSEKAGEYFMGGQLLLIVTGITAIGSLLAIIALVVRQPADPTKSRLESLSATATGPPGGTQRSSATASRDSASQVGERLVQAGLYRRNSFAFYVLTKLTLALVPVLVGLGAAFLGRVTLLEGCVVGGILGLLGTILPSFWLDARKRKRQTDMRRALPDALDVVVVCMEAGLSLAAALARVARELRTAHPLLCAEMKIVERETQLGYSTGQAIKRFGQRFDLEEVRSLASVVLQAEKFGASVSKALRVHAESLRFARFQRAEEKAQKASAVLLFPTVFFIFPTLFVVLIGPAVMDIYKFLIELGIR
jgi:tight adherence protein C